MVIVGSKCWQMYQQHGALGFVFIIRGCTHLVIPEGNSHPSINDRFGCAFSIKHTFCCWTSPSPAGIGSVGDFTP